MTIRQLEVFLGVTQAKSFSRAAERIHLSQPTLSEHMRELEEELGVRLFIRHPRSVSLTEAGRIFGDYATRVVATLAAGRHWQSSKVLSKYRWSSATARHQERTSCRRSSRAFEIPIPESPSRSG